MKIAVIGGGSTYTPELIAGFLARASSLPLTELWLMDIDGERLSVVGGFAQRMVESTGAPFRVVLTPDQGDAVAGASYVCTQLRVGQMAARREDEYLGRRHRLIGQETTGVGGMAKALRTIPVVLGIADDMRASAPGALLVNFTNPAGLITEALARYAPDIPAVGVCNVAITTKMRLLGLLEARLGQSLDPDRAELKTLGLNHLTWHYGFTLDGYDVWPVLFDAYLSSQKESSAPEWDSRTLESLQAIPNYYLQYFYYTARKLAEQEAWPPSRAEQVQQIESRLLAYYADQANTEPPADLMLRGGAYYSTVAAQLLDAHYNDSGEVHVVNVPHNGAVRGVPVEWVLEMPCRVRRDSIEPLPAEPLAPAIMDLMTAVKRYEILTADAAVNGERAAAYRALQEHPLGPPAERVQVVLDDMLQTHRSYLPQFWS